MTAVKPDYYDSFRCAGGLCPFTCCRDWSIPVDPDTERKWSRLRQPGCTGKKFLPLSTVIRSEEGQRVIRLNRNGYCPLLRADGLCSAVCIYGEGVLSETCHTYPREVHRFRTRTEYSLALGCPAAVELLLNSGSFHLTSDSHNRNEENSCHACTDSCLTNVTDPGMQPCAVSGDPESCEKTGFAFRDHMINLVQDSQYALETALGMMFWYISDLKEKGPRIPENYMITVLSAYHRAELSAGVLNVKNSPENIMAEQNSIFLDLAGRYMSKNMYREILVPLIRTAELMDSDTAEFLKASSRRPEFVLQLKNYESMFRCLIAEELYTGLYMPDAETSGMMLKAEWTGMFFGLLKHCAFLRFIANCRITGEDMKELICVLIRMTGYSDDEISEYLCLSYSSPFWNWSYFALIIS